MDYEATQRLQPYLSANERVRWSGRPRQGVAFRPYDLFLVPFSLLWCGFAVFWESAVVTAGDVFMMLWGVPFILVGFYFVFGRFIYDAHVRARTYYALTDRNAFILGGFNGDKLTTVDLKALTELHLKAGADGCGNIVFGPDNNNQFAFANRYYVAPSPEFFGISDVNNVYALVQQHRRGA